MNISETEFKKLSKKQQEKLDKTVEYIKTKGNFAQTAEEEVALRKSLKLSPHICPCHICHVATNRKTIESFSMPQVVVFKARDFSEDNLHFIIAPFRHMSNEEFISSRIFGFIGKMFTILKAILSYQYGKIIRYEMKMDNTYGTYQQEIGEHGHVSVTFFKEKK